MARPHGTGSGATGRRMHLPARPENPVCDADAPVSAGAGVLLARGNALAVPEGSDADFILCPPRRKDLEDEVPKTRFDTLTPCTLAPQTGTPARRHQRP